MMEKPKILKMPYRIPTVLNCLNSINKKKKIKIRYRELKESTFSLYLDIWHNGNRTYEFLKLYIIGIKASRKKDDEILGFAIAYRDKRELELIQNDTGINFDNSKSKANFIEYFKAIKDKKNSDSVYDNTYRHLVRYTKGKVQFRQVNAHFCNSFINFLLTKVSGNSAHSYLARFRAVLNQAVRDEIINKNPTDGITIKREETKIDYLTEEEIRKLKATPLYHDNVKNSFLFSCFTGLRLSDIRNLKYDQIKEGFLYVRQKKTKDLLRLKLNESALDILELQIQLTNGKDFVFDMPKTRDHINLLLKSWASFAGITKNLHFHISRHTYATLLLTYDIDLYTVSKLMGHKEIRTTQRYAKLIDKKKDEAILRLPKI